MKRTRFIHVLAAGLFTVAALPVLAADEELPKAEKVIDRFIEATGGRKAYEKHHSEVASLSMEIVGKGIKASGTRYTDTSNNSLETFTIEGIGKIDSGVNNGVAWESNAITGARVMSGVEKADRLRAASFNAPLHWKDLWKSAETTALETVDGEECYVVVMTAAEGKPETNYYSKVTGLMVKQTRVTTTPMGEMPVEILAKDYREFDGLKMPTKLTQKAAGNEILITIDNVKFNTMIPADRYDPPADIKKLLAK